MPSIGQFTELKLFNMQGQNLLSKSVNNTFAKVVDFDLSQIEKGTYVLKIIGNQQSESHLIIINR
jgi:hypothetical protein